MAESGNFNRLVSELSLEERQNLLEKLKKQSTLSPDPLYVEEEEEAGSADIEGWYRQLPWYYRLWYFILGIFKARSPLKIFEDRQFAVLGRRVEELSPGLYDYQQYMLLPAFLAQFELLRDASRFFYTALDASVNRDKGTYYAFLGSLEMGNIHKRLEEETDPRIIGEKNPEMPEQELRRLAFSGMEEALDSIGPEEKNLMYSDARSLTCLKELASFLFDRVIMAFSLDSPTGGYSCSINVVKELLISLNNILFSLKVIPPMTLLESLFVFLLQERVKEQGFDINREIQDLLSRAENSLMVIREFSRQVPLTLILRCGCRNMALVPHSIGGGEDWFIIYREYWKRHIETLFAEYMQVRRHQELLNSFRYFLKGTNLKILGNVVSDSNPEGLPIDGAFGLSFLLTFYSVVFMPDINRILRPILIDGDFYRKENRAEFAESYNDLIKLEDDIKQFEAGIAPSGDYGKRYSQARQDMSSLPVKRRKIQLVLEEASDAAESIISRAGAASLSMVNILGGIIEKDPRGKYDSLANLSKLSGKDGQFINGIAESVQKFKKVLQILEDIGIMETGR
ncbi:MAG: DUF5312 domain-containing protein [Treponema sp.]|jgi:hypothetical protein|nr:DUF5312 domain-containing protein [Treponema sp.]